MKKDMVSRDLVETMLNKLGGIDSSEEWAQGWDAAINTAVGELRSLPSTIKPKRENFHGLGNIRPARYCGECPYLYGGVGEEEETYCGLYIPDEDPLLVEGKNGLGCLYSDRQLSIREEYYNTYYDRVSPEHNDHCYDDKLFLVGEDYEE